MSWLWTCTGTVTGFIETDGTLGVLGVPNITDWVLTLTSPNLVGGSPDVISFATQHNTSVGSTTATPTQLLFDFNVGGPGTNFVVQDSLAGGSQNYWCLACQVGGEQIGGGISSSYAESVSRSGVVVFAEVAAAPEPNTWLLLAGVGIALAWRHRHDTQTDCLSETPGA
jgi:hypothetical protein